MDGESQRHVLLCKRFVLCSSLSLVVGTTSLLLFAHASKTLRTSSAHTPSAKHHLRGVPNTGVLAQATYLSHTGMI